MHFGCEHASSRLFQVMDNFALHHCPGLSLLHLLLRFLLLLLLPHLHFLLTDCLHQLLLLAVASLPWFVKFSEQQAPLPREPILLKECWCVKSTPTLLFHSTLHVLLVTALRFLCTSAILVENAFCNMSRSAVSNLAVDWFLGHRVRNKLDSEDHRFIIADCNRSSNAWALGC